MMRLSFRDVAGTGALLFFLGLTFERRAYGYTDPGTVILVFQNISAVIVGSIFYFRKRLRKLTSMVIKPAKRTE